MLFSVSVLACGDREMTREEIVELADAVAGHSGVASGIGTTSYGARLLVDAEDRAAAVAAGRAAFSAAVARAGLPGWPVISARALAEGEDDVDEDDVEEDDVDGDDGLGGDVDEVGAGGIPGGVPGAADGFGARS